MIVKRGEIPAPLDLWLESVQGAGLFTMASLVQIVESLFFAAQRPLSPKDLAGMIRGAASFFDREDVQAFDKVKEQEVVEAIDSLQQQYRESERAFQLVEQATGWQLLTSPDYSPWIRQLFPDAKPSRLSAPALETLAIIAYRQPITRADMEAVRGVAVDGVLQTLLDRGLVKIAGRADIPGRPLLYESTATFLEHFNLKSLDELPNASELRRVQLPVAADTAPTPLPATADAQMSLDEAPTADAALTTADAAPTDAPPAPAHEADPEAPETEPTPDGSQENDPAPHSETAA